MAQYADKLSRFGDFGASENETQGKQSHLHHLHGRIDSAFERPCGVPRQFFLPLPIVRRLPFSSSITGALSHCLINARTVLALICSATTARKFVWRIVSKYLDRSASIT